MCVYAADPTFPYSGKHCISASVSVGYDITVPQGAELTGSLNLT